MDEVAFERRLRAAVSAGWRLLLIEAAALTLVWLVYLAWVPAHPAVLLMAWGPDVSWVTVANVSLQAMALFKLALWLQAGLVLWACMWAAILRRTREPASERETGRAEEVRTPGRNAGETGAG